MSVTPIQSAQQISPVKPGSGRQGDDDFAAIFAGYTGAMIAGGLSAIADPRDAIAAEPTARSERIEGEVADMRQAELARPSAAKRDAAQVHVRFDANALRREARLQSTDARSEGALSKPAQSSPAQISRQSSAELGAGRAAIESALRSESFSSDKPKIAEQTQATQPTPKSNVPGSTPAPTGESASPRSIARPVATSAPNSDASRADAARSIARILARDFGGPSARDPSLQPAATNRGPQTADQPRSAQAQTDSANRSDTSPRADDEMSSKRTEFAKLMRNVRLNVGQKQSSATIQMNPPQLGRLRIDVRMTDQRLSVQVETQTPEGRAMMTERAGELFDALRAGGIEVEQFEITAAAQREGLTVARVNLPRGDNDGSPHLKRTYRRNDDSGAERDEARNQSEGLDRGGLSLRA